MADLIEDFQSYFVSKGLATVDQIFRDASPETKDFAVIIYEYEGAGALPQVAGASRNIQVVARDKSATAAKLKARELHHSLETEDGILNLTVDRWSLIYIKQPPFKLKTEKEMVYYCFNILVTTFSD